jgi:hypothetical protein
MKTKEHQPLKLDTEKTVLSFALKRGNGGSNKQRAKAEEAGEKIPQHRFMHDTPQVCITSITKGEAVDIMRFYNLDNRSMGSALPKRYCSEFLANDWKLTGDALKFSDNSSATIPNQLLDGQNRLAGYVLACEQMEKEGKAPSPYRTVVVSGLPSGVQKKMDRNQKRSIADLFQFSEVKAVNRLAFSLARNWMGDRYQKNNSGTEIYGQVSDRDIKKAFELYGEAINSTAEKMAQGINKSKNVAITLACAMYSHQNPEKGAEFTNRLVTGENLTAGCPILSLRNYFTKATPTSTRANDGRSAFRKAYFAINRWHNGDKIINLVEHKGLFDWDYLGSKQLDNSPV